MERLASAIGVPIFTAYFKNVLVPNWIISNLISIKINQLDHAIVKTGFLQ